MKMWSHKLSDFSITYPSNITDSFIWETSPIHKNTDTQYKEVFIPNPRLPQIQDYSSFEEHIINSKSKSAVSFFNPSKTTLLVIPIPRKNKNYATLKNFLDEASFEQKQKFFAKIRKEINNMLKLHDKIFVSTHGFGVPYLHVRIEPYPKYFLSNFKNM